MEGVKNSAGDRGAGFGYVFYMNDHTYSCRVYYDDTDAGGIVYYANYLKFAERARTEWLRDRGIESSSLRRDLGVLIVVKKVEIDYQSPARLDDMLLVETGVMAVGGSSMNLTQNVFRVGQGGGLARGQEVDVMRQPICAMTIVLVCVSETTGRPVRWPECILEMQR